ncbi:MAG: colicin immunity domain-containing protein [Bacteroidota bacterium]
MIDLFLHNKLPVNEFEQLFLEIRREDTFLFSGNFDEQVESLLSTLFLDVSDYAPPHLFDPTSAIDLNEQELRKRLIKHYEVLQGMIA